VDDPIEWVSASELAAYTYCGRSYWLERVVHAEVTGPHELRRTAGVDAHAAHGRRVAIARLLRRSAIVAALVMVLALLFLIS
jgi:hypothetical protein